ncbi:endo-beta-1,4-Glucuronan lyase from fungus Trichoderma Reesei [Mariannaea sp. PMI_226]|nr:endo-beta-1,4-Glucuronan lyase from fungus Trichoderma Reesei [Mariannaea sp. PMI_226]
MVAVKSLFAAAAALLPWAEASQLFYNSGTMDGFDASRHENKGTVSTVTNLAYKGASSLKMTQTYTKGYTGRYHSEVDHNNGYKRGDTRFYGFAFRLQENWEFDSQGYNIAQFIADRPGAGCDDDDWMPSSMVWIEGNKLASRIVTGQYRQPDCGRKITAFNNLATVSAGVWHTIVIQANWQSGSTGYYKMWFDGAKVLEKTNLATTINDDVEFAFRVGLYANSWHDDGQMLGSQPFRQVWYDEVAVGTTFQDVDPAT